MKILLKSKKEYVVFREVYHVHVFQDFVHRTDRVFHDILISVVLFLLLNKEPEETFVKGLFKHVAMYNEDVICVYTLVDSPLFGFF